MLNSLMLNITKSLTPYFFRFLIQIGNKLQMKMELGEIMAIITFYS